MRLAQLHQDFEFVPKFGISLVVSEGTDVDEPVQRTIVDELAERVVSGEVDDPVENFVGQAREGWLCHDAAYIVAGGLFAC